ncbi:hypothetical protein BC827DRAFT_1377997 [Russula dissimulans]|nr:hypothetical protein BC827DRAFT_1377997 [Russula dissimulans]
MLQPFTRLLTLSNASDCLLEIVNFNVEGQKYVCAGKLVASQALTNVLNYLKMHCKTLPSELKRVDTTLRAYSTRLTSPSRAKVKEMLKGIVNDCYESALEKPETGGYITLERASGLATVPLSGIDAPFHSCYPWSGVMPFCAYLSKKIHADLLDPSLLNGVYIPDLVASPFAVHKAYAEPIYNRALSPRLSERLTHPQHIGMAVHTLKAKYEAKDNPTGLYQFEDKPEATSELDVPPEAATPSPAPVTAAPTVVTPPLVCTAAASLATAIEDASICAVDILAAIVS